MGATWEENNPIAQDIKKGKLRDYHGPIFWNYGCLPQTWEDPNIEHPTLKVSGDDDPIDVVEIGSSSLSMGSVTAVKPLGVLAMIDDGELDWKVVAISTSDPMAGKLNDVSDIEKEMPGVISGIREWFRWYKTPDDKPLNGFGFDEGASPRLKRWMLSRRRTGTGKRSWREMPMAAKYGRSKAARGRVERNPESLKRSSAVYQ